jgi:hypothetical protein
VGVGVCFHKLGVALFRSPANTHVTIFSGPSGTQKGKTRCGRRGNLKLLIGLECAALDDATAQG